MQLHEAKQIANWCLYHLKPHCHRLEIAGSIRREKPEVKDIEIVCIPKKVQSFTETRGDLFTPPTKTPILTPSTGFIEQICAWKKVKGDPKGKYTKRELPNGAILDLFICTPENWGLIFFIRTGSADYSKQMMKRLQAKGYKSDHGQMYRHGVPVDCREERDVFEMAQKAFIIPKFRT